MDQISKSLKKLSGQERSIVKDILKQISSKQTSNLNLKKLKGRDNIFRVRKGKIRIIYRQDNSGHIFLLTIERRNDNTYNNF